MKRRAQPAPRPQELDLLAARLRDRQRRTLVSSRQGKEASVLVPLVSKDGVLHVLFTLRTQGVPTHKGQVAFPGGGREDDDDDVVATALREAEEELGIHPSWVDVLGLGDDALSITGQKVTPVVGYLAELPELRPSEREIADVFTMPLTDLQRPGAVSDHQLTGSDGREHRVPFFEGGKHTIWGLTAWILKEVLSIWDGVDRGPSPLR